MAIITDGVKTKFTDDTGLPLIGGQVFSYVEGTSTPKDTYQDRAFTIPNTNPIILDDVGSCEMYLKGGYRLRVLTADNVLVEEKDNAFQSDGQVLDVVANTTAIAALQTNVDVLNTRGGLKTDANNHIIGQGKAESATVYDISLRSDKVRVSAPTATEFGDLIFKTYDAPTVVNGKTVPKGTYINPNLFFTPFLGTAATKDTGVAIGQIPVAEQVYKAAFSSISGIYDTGDSFNVNGMESGVIALIAKDKLPSLSYASPSDDYFIVEQKSFNNEHLQAEQVATGYRTGARFQRIRSYIGIYEGDWKPFTTNTLTYISTTAAGANVVVDVTGRLTRSTSSERYKDILAPLELDDARYADAMSLKPIVYRSTADADNPTYHYYSFSAEELGAYDPAFTLWRTTEMVTDADGNMTEQPLAERQAEGININALLAMSHAIAIKQGELIKSLEARIKNLESKTP